MVSVSKAFRGPLLGRTRVWDRDSQDNSFFVTVIRR